jgi:hypothetical protein
MTNGQTIEALIDLLAEKVAAKVRAELVQNGSGQAIRRRLLTVEQGAIRNGRTVLGCSSGAASG